MHRKRLSFDLTVRNLIEKSINNQAKTEDERTKRVKHQGGLTNIPSPPFVPGLCVFKRVKAVCSDRKESLARNRISV